MQCIKYWITKNKKSRERCIEKWNTTYSMVLYFIFLAPFLFFCTPIFCVKFAIIDNESVLCTIFQAICCEHFTCIDLLQVEIINDPMGRQSTTEDDTLKKKFSATAKIAALLSSGSSSKSDTSVFGEKSSGKKSSGIVMKLDHLSRVWDWVEFG